MAEEGNDAYTLISEDLIVGKCLHPRHPGCLDAPMMRERQCLERRCHWFEKNNGYLFWKNDPAKKDLRTKRQKEMDFLRGEREWREVKAPKLRAAKLEDIFCRAKQIAASRGYDIILTRIHQTDYRETHFHYIINYVSARPYNDYSMYASLAVELNRTFQKRFKLVHVKDIHGRYVTSAEWLKHHPEKRKGQDAAGY